MGTDYVWTKTGLRLVCPTNKRALPKPLGGPVVVPDFAHVSSPLVQAALETVAASGRQGIRISMLGADPLPTSGPWTLYHASYETAPAVIPWKAIHLGLVQVISHLITDPQAGATHRFYLSDGSVSYPQFEVDVPNDLLTGIITPGGAPQTAVDAINSADSMVNADKIQLISAWGSELQTQIALDAQATALLVSRTAYDAAVAALSTGLIAAGAPPTWATAWPDGTTWNHAGIMTSLQGWWAAIASAREALRNAITAKVQTTANYALSAFTDAAADGQLTDAEKADLRIYLEGTRLKWNQAYDAAVARGSSTTYPTPNSVANVREELWKLSYAYFARLLYTTTGSYDSHGSISLGAPLAGTFLFNSVVPGDDHNPLVYATWINGLTGAAGAALVAAAAAPATSAQAGAIKGGGTGGYSIAADGTLNIPASLGSTALWGGIGGSILAQADLQAALSGKLSTVAAATITDATSIGRSLLTAATAAVALTALGALGTTAQAYDAARLGGVAAASFVQTTDSRLSDARPASDVYSWAKASVKPAYTYLEVGAVSSSDSRLSDARPASDVYAWAKSSVKPAYSFGEIGSGPISATTATFVNATGVLLSAQTSNGYSALQWSGDGGTSFGSMTTWAGNVYIGRRSGTTGAKEDILIDNATGNIRFGTSGAAGITAAGALSATTVTASGPITANDTYLKFTTPSVNPYARNFSLGQTDAYGQVNLRISNANGGDPVAAGSSSIFSASLAAFNVPGNINADGVITAARLQLNNDDFLSWGGSFNTSPAIYGKVGIGIGLYPSGYGSSPALFLAPGGAATFATSVTVNGLLTAQYTRIKGGGSYFNSPTLGSDVGQFAIMGTNGLFGCYAGVSTNGDTWFQSQRNDGNTAQYQIVLQPAGGNTACGGPFSATAASISGAVVAYQFQGNGNLAGTGFASYHPSGIFSQGTNWLYGPLYTNGNLINNEDFGRPTGRTLSFHRTSPREIRS
jgi:hypothetical protein